MRSSLGDFDEISLFSSNVSERIVFNLNPRQDWPPEFIHLFAARGRDQSVAKVPSEDYVLAIHGQKVMIWMQADSAVRLNLMVGQGAMF